MLNFTSFAGNVFLGSLLHSVQAAWPDHFIEFVERLNFIHFKIFLVILFEPPSSVISLFAQNLTFGFRPLPLQRVFFIWACAVEITFYFGVFLILCTPDFGSYDFWWMPSHCRVGFLQMTFRICSQGNTWHHSYVDSYFFEPYGNIARA